MEYRKLVYSIDFVKILKVYLHNDVDCFIIINGNEASSKFIQIMSENKIVAYIGEINIELFILY